jgi:hypothetical protein
VENDLHLFSLFTHNVRTPKEKAMYTCTNFKTKKVLKDAVAAGERVRLKAPGLGTPVYNGVEFVEGPRSPSSTG